MKADSPGTLPPSRHWRIKLKRFAVWCGSVVAMQYHEALERDRKTGDAHSAAHSLAVDSDGPLLAVGDDTGTIRLWNIAESSSPVSLATVVHAGVITAVSLRSGALLLATGSAGRTIALWSVTDPRHPAMLSTLDYRTGPLSTVHALALSPNGRSMAAGGWNGTRQPA